MDSQLLEGGDDVRRCCCRNPGTEKTADLFGLGRQPARLRVVRGAVDLQQGADIARESCSKLLSVYNFDFTVHIL
jgi:hypothetical protein